MIFPIYSSPFFLAVIPFLSFATHGVRSLEISMLKIVFNVMDVLLHSMLHYSAVLYVCIRIDEAGTVLK